MDKTNKMRAIVGDIVRGVCPQAYHQLADEDALYPHAVYNIKSTGVSDLHRRDYFVDVDVWANDEDRMQAADLADGIEAAFDRLNKPGDKCFPTFYLNNRTQVDDDNKSLTHELVQFVAQTYWEE